MIRFDQRWITKETMMILRMLCSGSDVGVEIATKLSSNPSYIRLMLNEIQKKINETKDCDQTKEETTNIACVSTHIDVTLSYCILYVLISLTGTFIIPFMKCQGNSLQSFYFR